VSEPVDVRLDKWLQVARVFKTRSQATRACSLGRVRVNGAPAKAHRPLAVGDRVEVALGERERILEVRGLRDRPVPKTEARELFEDHSPPPPPRDSLERLLARPPVRREPGAGRPTKRERRQIDRLRGDD
jgi:ribosome-associated heat shock protein Hsp15